MIQLVWTEATKAVLHMKCTCFHMCVYLHICMYQCLCVCVSFFVSLSLSTYLSSISPTRSQKTNKRMPCAKQPRTHSRRSSTRRRGAYMRSQQQDVFPNPEHPGTSVVRVGVPEACCLRSLSPDVLLWRAFWPGDV